MVDSVSNSSSPNSLLRAQQAANLAFNAAKNPQIINQTSSAAVVPVKAAAVPQTIKLAGTPDRLLPRGSLIDTLV